LGFIERRNLRGAAPPDSAGDWPNAWFIQLGGITDELVLVDPANRIYRTRHESHLVVSSPAFGVFDGWTAWDRSGLRYEFSGSNGRTQFLRRIVAPTGEVLEIEWSDLWFGNTTPLPLRIVYPDASGYSVYFGWEPRPDPVSRAVGGVLQSLTARLRSIAVVDPRGFPIRTYEFRYRSSHDSGRSLLVGVDCRAGDFVVSIGFEYSTNEGRAPWGDPVRHGAGTFYTFARRNRDYPFTYEPTGTFLLDFNGDHLPDIVRAGPGALERRAHLRSESFFGANLGGPAGSFRNAFVQLADVDGDGFPEVIRRHDHRTAEGAPAAIGEDGIHPDGIWSLSGAFRAEVPVVLSSSSWFQERVDDFEMRTWDVRRSHGWIALDVDGDGLADFLRATRRGYPWESGEIREGLVHALTGRFVWNPDDRYHPPVDFVARFNAGTAYEYSHDRGVRFADLNGDGLPDIVAGATRVSSGGSFSSNDPSPSGWHDLTSEDANLGTSGVWLNTGSGWSPNVASSLRWGDSSGSLLRSAQTPAFVRWRENWNPVEYSSREQGWAIVDVNGDGQPDCIRAYEHGTREDPHYAHEFDAYINRGSLAFEERPEYRLPVALSTSRDPDNAVRFADVNGDGLVDLVQSADDLPVDYVWVNRLTIPDQLTRVTHPLGAVTEIEYRTNPAVGVRMPAIARIVSEIRTSPDPSSGVWTRQYYDFFEPLTENNEAVWPRLAQFRGFARCRITIPTPEPEDPDLVTETRYEVADESTAGRVLSVDEYELSAGGPRLARRTEYGYHAYSVSAPFWTPVRSIRTFAYNPPGSSKPVEHLVSYEYDHCGNVVVEYDHGDPYLAGDDSQIYREFACPFGGSKDTKTGATPAHWIRDRLVFESIDARHPGDFGERRTVRFSMMYYDDLPFGEIGRGLLTQVVTAAAEAPLAQRIDRYSYDDLGNVRTHTSPTGVVTTYEHDPRGLFVVRKTDPLGSIVYRRHGVESLPGTGPYGFLGRREHFDGSWEERDYDTLGRPTRERRSTGAQRVHQFRLFTGGAVRHVLHSETLYEPRPGREGWITEEVVLDGWGRETERYREGDTAWSVTTRTYWNRGPVRRVSGPAPDSFRETFHDPIGRPVRVVSPLGTVRIEYVERSRITSDEGGHRSVEVLNARGLPIEVTTSAGTTRYSFDSLGHLAQVADLGGNTTTVRYDGLGRKIALEDPNSGSWSWTYTVFDAVETSTDALGNRITDVFDGMGRQIRRTYAGLPETRPVELIFDAYPPDAEPTDGERVRAVGRLVRMIDATGDTTYYYGEGGRVTRELRRIGDSSFATEYEYTRCGRLHRVRLPVPGGFDVTYTHSMQGPRTVEEWVPNWITYDQGDRPTTLAFSNGVVRRTSYDSATGRITGRTLTGPSGEALENCEYAYGNPGLPDHGQLVRMTDSAGGRQFEYDAEHRLISDGQDRLSYDPLGRLRFRNDRELEYTPARPHAVSRFAGRSYEYNANGDTVSIRDEASGETTSLAYSQERRVRHIASPRGWVGFTYDGAGNRTIKYTADAAHLYINPYLEVILRGGIRTYRAYVLLHGERMGSYETVDGTTSIRRFYHTDHQGSVTVVTDESGGIVSRLTYSAWGEMTAAQGSAPGYSYTGQRRDEETEFLDYGPRLYDPSMGRFLQADSVVPAPHDPLSLDRYAYARNNPVLYVDPTGHEFWRSFFASAAGVVAGSVVTAMTGNPVAGAIVGGAVAGGLNAHLHGASLLGIAVGASIGAGAGWVSAGLPLFSESAASGWIAGTGIGLGSTAYSVYRGDYADIAGGVLGGFAASVFYQSFRPGGPPRETVHEYDIWSFEPRTVAGEEYVDQLWAEYHGEAIGPPPQKTPMVRGRYFGGGRLSVLSTLEGPRRTEITLRLGSRYFTAGRGLMGRVLYFAARGIGARLIPVAGWMLTAYDVAGMMYQPVDPTALDTDMVGPGTDGSAP